MTRQTRSGALVLAALGALAMPTGAHAEFTPASILSASSQAQGGASSVALSADGRYAAFFLSFGSSLYTGPTPAGIASRSGGIFRRRADGTTLDLVVPASVTPAGGAGTTAGLTGSTVPSISADGRYVAFATSQSLVPEDENGVLDVYLRDMAIAEDAPGAYTLVSAHSDGTPLAYAGAPGGAEGSTVGPGALSDDGLRVAFLVRDGSDLAGPDTPAGQVAVRDLVTGATTLVSRKRDGDHGPVDAQLTDPINEPRISGDGSTVVWRARRASAQVMLLPDTGDGTTFAQDSVSQLLWRRIDDGEAAQTRLVTGSSDPDDPACVPGTPLTDGIAPAACDGPFLVGSPPAASEDNPVVTSAALSRDGRTVVVAAGTRRDTPGGIFGARTSEIYRVDMTPGLSRKQATRTLLGSPVPGAVNAADVAMSPDGTWVAFIGQWSSLLTPPSPAGPFPPTAGIAQAYGVDLAAGTITLLSRGFAGDAANQFVGGIGPVAIADGGERIAFVSAANNLVFGDANGAGPGSDVGRDAFLISQIHRPQTRPPVSLPAPFAEPKVPIAWALRVTATPARDGSLHIAAFVPAAGRIGAKAMSIPATIGRGRSRVRTLRTTAARASAPGLVRLVVRPSARDRRLAARRRGLPTRVTVTFTPTVTTGKALKRTLRATFKRRSSPAKRTTR